MTDYLSYLILFVLLGGLGHCLGSRLKSRAVLWYLLATFWLMVAGALVLATPSMREWLLAHLEPGELRLVWRLWLGAWAAHVPLGLGVALGRSWRRKLSRL